MNYGHEDPFGVMLYAGMAYVTMQKSIYLLSILLFAMFGYEYMQVDKLPRRPNGQAHITRAFL